MTRQPGPYYAHQRDIWMRHDAHLWIRHDINRFLAPGTDPADVIPALRRRRDAEDAAFAAEIAKGYRLLAVLCEEVASIKADLVRRRLAEQTKYSPAQPRVPAGNRGAVDVPASGGRAWPIAWTGWRADRGALDPNWRVKDAKATKKRQIWPKRAPN
jgi:hypothetical protein